MASPVSASTVMPAESQVTPTPPQRALPTLNPYRRMPGTSPPTRPVFTHARTASMQQQKQQQRAVSLGMSPDKAHARPLRIDTEADGAAQREHSRRCSNIHSRNLSAFFPKPGTDAAREYEMSRAQHSPASTPMTLMQDSPNEKSDIISPTKRRDRRSDRRASYMLASQADSPEAKLRVPSLGGSNDLTQLISPVHPSMKRTASSGTSMYSPVRTVSESYTSTIEAQRDTLKPLPCSTTVTAASSAVQFTLGAVLWVLGQVRDSLALVGFGFLLVFDTLGLVNALLKAKYINTSQEEHDALRLPYGRQRLESLLDFSLIVYLFFAGMYMGKENAEHALLASSAPHEEDRAGLVLPLGVLTLALGTTLGTNVVLRNHERLGVACDMCWDGSESLDGRPRRSAHSRNVSVLARPILAAQPLYDAFANPFSGMILFFACVLVGSALVIPSAQVASFDKLLAGLEGVAMMYVSLTALRPLCKLLLQAAPPTKNQQSLQLHRALSAVESHSAVAGIEQIQMWQLTLPSLGYTKAGLGTDGMRGLANVMSMHRDTISAPLIVSISIKVKGDATAQDCEEVSNTAWYHGSMALGIGTNCRVGDVVRGNMRVGDLAVRVTREGEDAKVEHHGHCHHHGHGHHHEHDHHHGHDHHHEHDHDHGHHHHEHDHDHEHHHHEHDHDHEHHHHEHDHHHEHRHAHLHDHEHDSHHSGHQHQHDHNHGHGHSHGSDHSHDHHSISRGDSPPPPDRPLPISP